MFATAGLVASAAIPVSSSPDSTTTPRLVYLNPLPILVTRDKVERNLLIHPFAAKYSSKDNRDMAKFHDEQADGHTALQKEYNSIAESHDRMAQTHKTLQESVDKAGVEGLEPESISIQHHENAAKEARDTANKQGILANMHSHMEKSHYLAANSKESGPTGDSVERGYAHYHEALEAWRGLPPASTAGTREGREKEVEDHEKRIDRYQESAETDYEHAHDRMSTMAAEHQKKLADKKDEPFPIDPAKIARAKPSKSIRRQGRENNNKWSKSLGF
ncbi:hypothetical protein FRC19_011419 [Serendipita sp. 401]|nr:hypothetical protein FRC19_011419 [Serendipita sp. 401]KAG9046004.1 hypothetical protein FS842_001030 [Serendipita sp. 407]